MPSLVCICQICTCGKHRCPHRPNADILNRSSQPCPLSEYTHQFKKYNTRPRSILKPPRKALSRDTKMDCQTISRQSYTPHPVTPSPPKPVVVYRPPQGALDTTSEYKKQFQGKWAVRAKLIRPQQTKREHCGPFDHKTSYGADFLVCQLPLREVHGEKRVYEAPTEPFEGTSTVQADFVNFGRVELTASLKPKQKAAVSTDPFDSTTCYRATFTPPPAMPARYQRPKAIYKPTEGQFCGTTTFVDDFPAHIGVLPAESMKPPQKANISDAPFEGTSTSRLSYRTWELPARHSRPPVVYTPPKEKFTAHSTFKSDYPNYGRVQLVRSMKPMLRNAREQVVPFEGLSTQNTDFKAWTDVVRPLPIRREKKYEPPTETFDAVSTFQSHYKGEFVPRSPSAKPPETKKYISSCKMETSTSYRDSYSRDGFKPCPALFLSSTPPPPEYVFSHQDSSTGHRFFSPLKDVPHQQSIVSSS